MRIEILMFCENITFIFGNGLHYLLPKNIGCFFARTGLYMHFKIQPGTSHFIALSLTHLTHLTH